MKKKHCSINQFLIIIWPRLSFCFSSISIMHYEKVLQAKYNSSVSSFDTVFQSSKKLNEELNVRHKPLIEVMTYTQNGTIMHSVDKTKNSQAFNTILGILLTKKIITIPNNTMAHLRSSFSCSELLLLVLALRFLMALQ